MIVRLHDGEDFHPTLLSALEEVDLTRGIIVTGVGMLTDFEVGWFDRASGSYRSTTFGTPHELLSLNGSVAPVEGEDTVMPHVHASLAGPDHTVVGTSTRPPWPCSTRSRYSGSAHPCTVASTPTPA